MTARTERITLPHRGHRLLVSQPDNAARKCWRIAALYPTFKLSRLTYRKGWVCGLSEANAHAQTALVCAYWLTVCCLIDTSNLQQMEYVPRPLI